jgi:nitroreductase
LAQLVAAGLVQVLALSAQDKFAAVPERMQAFVDQGEIAGAVTLVATKDKILHVAAMGRSDLATGYRGGFDRAALAAKLGLRATQEIIAIQPVGYPAPEGP